MEYARVPLAPFAIGLILAPPAEGQLRSRLADLPRLPPAPGRGGGGGDGRRLSVCPAGRGRKPL